MKITIHRGSHEIGGTVIELAVGNTKLLLDMGLPLSDEAQPLDVQSMKPDAVLISHPHQDHFGLIDQLDDEVPVYIGKTAKELIVGLRKFIGKKIPTNSFIHFEKWETFSVGNIMITPYLLDHSSVDAYAFLIEAGGKKVLYSGDFRATGHKSFLFDKLLEETPPNIDMLLMEGTMMRRENSNFPNEASVAKTISAVLKEQTNISFLISSSQNIDRIVSAAHGCQDNGKILIIDIYTAWVLESIGKISKKTPTMNWDCVKIYAGRSFDQAVKNSPEYFGDFRYRLYRHRITIDEIKECPEKYLMLTRMSGARFMEIFKESGPINVIYSQWLGYLECTDEDFGGAQKIAQYRESDPDVNFVYAHTSGHATKEDLKRLAARMQPAKLVPVHTEFPQDYANEFDNVVIVKDGESIEV